MKPSHAIQIQDSTPAPSPATKFSLLLIAFFFLSSSQMFAQEATIVKLNISPMFMGEFGGGFEHKLSKRTSVYGDLAWLNKDQNAISGKGIGSKAGLRYYFNLKRSYKKGRNKSKMKAFSGHFISAEGRYGRLSSSTESFILTEVDQYSKFALHYGIQRFWKNFYVNAEVGPSWGSSDFPDIGSKGYYTDGFNLDGRFAIGLAF